MSVIGVGGLVGSWTDATCRFDPLPFAFLGFFFAELAGCFVFCYVIELVWGTYGDVFGRIRR